MVDMAEARPEQTCLSFNLDASRGTISDVFEQEIGQECRIMPQGFECLETHLLQRVLAEFMAVAGSQPLNP